MKEICSLFPAKIFRQLLPVFLLSLLLSSCSAIRPTVKKLDTTFKESKIFQKGFAGLVIMDPTTGKIIYDHNGDKYFTPASNVKLFTYYAGLKLLGDSVPAFRYETRNDTLYFKGTGDPSFLNSNLPVSGALNFLQKKQGTLAYVEPEWHDAHFGPGWAWDDYNSGYSAEKSPFPLYGNLVGFTRNRKGHITVEPRLFKDSLRVRLPGDASERIRREPDKNHFYYPATQAELSQHIPFRYSTALMRDLLSDILDKEIYIVPKPEGISLQKTYYSIHTDSLYKRVLQESDNFVAEQVLLMASEAVSDTLSSRIAIDHMVKNYLQNLPDEPIWRDGSGLSRYNLFTPRSVATLLHKIWLEVPRKNLFHLLPAGGESGTLKNQFISHPPFIYAKTGSLSNNYSLSGYLITQKNEVLIFSFMNSNYTIPASKLKAEMEDILRAVHRNF